VQKTYSNIRNSWL